ncbi:MAG: CPBP family glutamic-type intramembrane protease [Candidatus Binatus sp.]|uniref:CPBP family glutamic-type intramembrane protease n=2 Tax=Candidatus Binatus sp. TaxID=2811406 RepID=UPI003BAF1DCB
MWMILAGLGTLVSVGFDFIRMRQFAPGTDLSVSVEFIIISAVLIALIPVAVKINHKLDLPGGPLITATLGREPQPYRWRDVVLGGVLWAVILMIIALVGTGLFLYFFPSFIPKHPINKTPIVKPSELWLLCGVVIAASAGVQEEILFRFVLIGLFSRTLMTIKGNAEQRPSRGLLWLATIMQAYCFGMAHVRPDFYLARGIAGVGEFAIHALIQPQTWTGIFLGWLYLSRGLETAMVTHIFLDLL